MLSEDVDSRTLSERIFDVVRNERNGLFIFQMGVGLVFAGVVFWVFGKNTVV